ncbi:putative TIR domain, P-loop containing nucleoside triphosphate hydrolase [Helianthus anomalus]
MASTSSSSSTSAPTTHYEYDVFLSFRGEDTRHSFTDHLYKALHQAGIRTFRDDDEIREGRQLKPEIERSITTSRASIIVISNNFANSRWCLDELSLILQQKRNAGHFVFPVFYGVHPSDVRNQRGSFTIEAKEGSKWTEDNVIRWKEALTEVADLKGMVVSGSETAFIANIVQKVYCELHLKLLSTPTGLTGIETRAEGINSWLRSEQPGHSVLAICGMGGSGKTTLAKYIYNLNKQNFECSSFLEGIENQPAVLLGLQKQLLRDVSGNNIMISNLSEGAFQIEKVIERKRVLIVIDDIDDKDTLNSLVGTNVFGTQSKIIITTRQLSIHTWFGSISSGCYVHEVELLNDHESLELLSYHAFGSKVPMEGFEEFAIQLAQYCEGNPLALKVLGSSLSEGQGTRIETWRSTMNSLNS